MSDLTTKAAEIRAGLARKLSDALLTVRPLGGSELFMRVGDEFYADPAVCAAEIAKLRSDLHEARTALARERREKDALIEQQAAELAEADRERLSHLNTRASRERWKVSTFKEQRRATTAESERDELLREKERHWGGIRECPQEPSAVQLRAWIEHIRADVKAGLVPYDSSFDEALRLVEMVHAWRPIETAPEDGSVILVYRKDAGVFTAHYVEEDAHLSSATNPPEGEFFWFSTSGEDLSGDMPNHWMPLPLPPEGSGQNLADANSKSPAPSSQSERIAVLEAAGREIKTLVDEYDPKNSDWYFRRTVIRELFARSALAPLGEE